MKRWTIRRQLAAFIAAICMLGVVAQAIFTQLSFRSGFASYIEAAHRPKLEVIATQLADNYHQSLKWQAVVDTPGLWVHITRSRADVLEPPDADTGPVTAGLFREQNDLRPGNFPLEGRSPGTAPPAGFSPGGNPPIYNPPPRMGPRPQDVLGTPEGMDLALLDVDRQFVVGNSSVLDERGRLEVEIQVDGSVVGYLSSPGGMHIADALDDAFSSELLRQAILIGSCIAVLSLVAAVFIAKQFSRPVTRLNECADELMQGNYDTQIPTDGPLEFGLLEQKFNRLAQTLAANRTTQQHWIANISHELRTPLAVLRAELDALDAGIRTFDSDQLHSLIEECQRLNRLVDDLFFLSRSDAGDLSYQFSEIDLKELVRELAEESRKRVRQAGIDLEVSLPDEAVPLIADEGRLRQLLGNLINNSCAYTDDGGQMRIRLVVGSDEVFFDLDDSAPGVPELERAKIFDRLYRVEKSRNRSGGGSGLGLAICNAIAEAHGAKIQAFDSDIGGLRIRVSFPKK